MLVTFILQYHSPVYWTLLDELEKVPPKELGKELAKYPETRKSEWFQTVLNHSEHTKTLHFRLFRIPQMYHEINSIWTETLYRHLSEVKIISNKNYSHVIQEALMISYYPHEANPREFCKLHPKRPNDVLI